MSSPSMVPPSTRSAEAAGVYLELGVDRIQRLGRPEPVRPSTRWRPRKAARIGPGSTAGIDSETWCAGASLSGPGAGPSYGQSVDWPLMVLSAVPGGIFRVTQLGAPHGSPFTRRSADSRARDSATSIAGAARDRLLSRAKPPRKRPAAMPAADPQPADAGPPESITGSSSKPPRKRPTAAPAADPKPADAGPPASTTGPSGKPPRKHSAATPAPVEAAPTAKPPRKRSAATPAVDATTGVVPGSVVAGPKPSTAGASVKPRKHSAATPVVEAPPVADVKLGAGAPNAEADTATIEPRTTPPPPPSTTPPIAATPAPRPATASPNVISPPPPRLTPSPVEPTPPAVASQPPPPVSVVLVHRSGVRSASAAPPPGRRRPALGDDPMDEDPPTRTFRRVIDRLMSDIADRRDDDRDEGGS